MFFDQTHLCLSSNEVDVMNDAIELLKHFEQATREISAESTSQFLKSYLWPGCCNM